MLGMEPYLRSPAPAPNPPTTPQPALRWLPKETSMSKSEKPQLAHLLEHHPDAESGFCELCEASSIASVVLPHAIALGERSEISLALMAAELAAQSIEAISHAENLDLELVLKAVRRRAKDLRTDRDSEGTEAEITRVHH